MNHMAWQKFTHVIEKHAPYSFRVYHENGGSTGLYSITSPKTVILTIIAMQTSNLTVWMPDIGKCLPNCPAFLARNQIYDHQTSINN